MPQKLDIVAAEAEFRRSLADAQGTCLYADYLIEKMRAKIIARQSSPRSRSNQPPAAH